MAHTHHISTGAGLSKVQTFPDEFEQRKFYSRVKDKSEIIFRQNLPENQGKTLSDIQSIVWQELMYRYIHNDLEGFDNYDNSSNLRP
jgi:hypothetical protein